MLLTSFFTWWYGAGWRLHASAARRRVARTGEFFSVITLITTLFSPYRQISAGAVKGNITMQWHAFVDRTVSRAVGFVVRSFLLLIGLICLLSLSLLSLLWLLFWPLLPAFPVIAVLLAASGVSVV